MTNPKKCIPFWTMMRGDEVKRSRRISHIKLKQILLPNIKRPCLEIINNEGYMDLTKVPKSQDSVLRTHNYCRYS